jgi:rod shape-determining protein MreB
MEVRGRDVQTGSPGAVIVSVAEVNAVTLPIIRRIADEVRNTLTELPAEVAGDIYDRGLILTGGGAQLDGLAQYLQKEVGLAISIADDPRFAIVRGLSQMFDEPLLLRRVAQTEAHPVFDAESTVFES